MTRRALPGQEQVDGLTLRRTLALPHQGQWLAGYQVIISQVLRSYGNARLGHQLPMTATL